MLAHIARSLESPRVPLLCAVLGVLLSLPSLGSGLHTDDRLLLAQIERGTPLYELFKVDPERYRSLKAQGTFAWWTGPDVDVAFLRPLGALSHQLDHALFGANALPMHLENILLYGLIVWLAAHAFRKLLPARSAGLAALLYTIDDLHGFSVGWISARNALLATAFGLGAVLAHLQREQRAARVASPILLALALASAEAGVAAVAFLAAHALVLVKEPFAARARALIPHAIVTFVWAGVYLLGGYGARGVGAYRELSAASLVQGMLDLPRWLFSELGVSVVGSLMAAPDGASVVVVALGLLLVALLWPIVRARKESHFFALGLLLAVLPLALTIPQDRVLLFASFGGAGFLACAFTSIADWRSRIARISLRTLATLHLVVSPLLFVPALTSLVPIDAASRALVAAFPREPGRVPILVHSPMELLSLYSPPIARQARGHGWDSVHQLYAGHAAVQVTRIDARTLELRVAPGYCARAIERLFTSPRWQPRPGDVQRVDPFDVHILAVNAAQRPTAVRFVFEHPLESARYHFLTWQGTAPVPWTPPRAGDTVQLPALPLLGSLPR